MPKHPIALACVFVALSPCFGHGMEIKLAGEVDSRVSKFKGQAAEITFVLGEATLNREQTAVYKQFEHNFTTVWNAPILDVFGHVEPSDAGWLEWTWESYEPPFHGTWIDDTIGFRLYDAEPGSQDVIQKHTHYSARSAGTIIAQYYDADGTPVLRDHLSLYHFDILEDTGRWLNGLSMLDIATGTSPCGGTMFAGRDGFNLTSCTVTHHDLLPGDANADGVFDQLDLVAVAAAGRYQNGDLVPWSQGDWNADGRFDQIDLMAALQTDAYAATSHAALTPEPSTAILLLFGLATWWYCRVPLRRKMMPQFLS